MRRTKLASIQAEQDMAVLVLVVTIVVIIINEAYGFLVGILQSFSYATSFVCLPLVSPRPFHYPRGSCRCG